MDFKGAYTDSALLQEYLCNTIQQKLHGVWRTAGVKQNSPEAQNPTTYYQKFPFSCSVRVGENATELFVFSSLIWQI